MQNCKESIMGLARAVVVVALFLSPFASSPATASSAEICGGECCGSADCDPGPPAQEPTPVTYNLEKVYSVLKDKIYTDALVNKIRPAIGQLTASIVGAGAGIVEAATRMTQALMDNEYKLSIAEVGARFAAQKMRTVAGDNLTCNAISANQLENMARIYSEVLSDYLSRNAYDFSFNTAEGPEVPRNSSAIRTKGPKCRGPLAGHGYQADCTSSTPVKEMAVAQCFLGTYDPQDYPEDPVKGFCGESDLGEESLVSGESSSKKPFSDMVRADTRMDTIFGKLSFVKAGGGINIYKDLFNRNRTEAKYVAKRQFLAAVNYCYNVYGFPPQRTKGGAAREGSSQASNFAAYFDLWEAQNFPVLQRCLQIVAEHTRPDCSDSSMSDLCAAMKQACNNAKDNGVDVSMYDCDQGLSYAEARDIAQESCLSSQEYVNLGGTTTATQADVIAHARECGRRVSAYRAELKRERDEFANIILGRFLPIADGDPSSNPKFSVGRVKSFFTK